MSIQYDTTIYIVMVIGGQMKTSMHLGDLWITVYVKATQWRTRRVFDWRGPGGVDVDRGFRNERGGVCARA